SLAHFFFVASYAFIFPSGLVGGADATYFARSAFSALIALMKLSSNDDVIARGCCHASCLALAAESPVVAGAAAAGWESPLILPFIFLFRLPNWALDVAGAHSATSTETMVKLPR